jgi:hypothetical protein
VISSSVKIGGIDSNGCIIQAPGEAMMGTDKMVLFLNGNRSWWEERREEEEREGDRDKEGYESLAVRIDAETVCLQSQVEIAERCEKGCTSSECCLNERQQTHHCGRCPLSNAFISKKFKVNPTGTRQKMGLL